MVAAQQALQTLVHPLALAAGEELIERHDERRLVDDPDLTVDHVRQLGERRHAVTSSGLRERLLGSLGHLRLELCAEVLHCGVHIHTRIPDLEVAHTQERLHRAAVRLDRAENGTLLVLDGVIIVDGGDQHAHRQTLDIPFPGAASRRSR